MWECSEFSEALSLQTRIFDPKQAAGDCMEQILDFLQDNTQLRQCIAASIIGKCSHLLAKRYECIAIFNELKQKGIITLEPDFYLEYFLEEDRRSLDEQHMLAKDEWLRNKIQVEFNQLPSEIAQSLLGDVPFDGIGQITKTLHTKLSKKPFKLIDLCIGMRAMNCFEVLRSQNTPFTDRSVHLAMKAFTEQEFMRYFSIPSENTKHFQELLFDALASRAFWMLRKSSAFVESPLFWRNVNQRFYLFPPSDLMKADMYAPASFGKALRARMFTDTFDADHYEQLQMTADALHNSEQFRLNQQEELIPYLVAEAGRNRPDRFDMLIRTAINLGLQFTREFFKWEWKFSTGLLEAGYKPHFSLQGIHDWRYFPWMKEEEQRALVDDEEFAKELEQHTGMSLKDHEDEDFESLKQLSHPGYTHPFGYCLYEDDIEELLSMLESVDMRLYHRWHPHYSVVGRSARFGSFLCYSYFAMNGYPIELDVIEGAIRGGNMEIVQSAFKEGYQPYMVQHCYVSAVCSRRWNVLQWLVDNYEYRSPPFSSFLYFSYLPSIESIERVKGFSHYIYDVYLPQPIRELFFKLIDSNGESGLMPLNL